MKVVAVAALALVTTLVARCGAAAEPTGPCVSDRDCGRHVCIAGRCGADGPVRAQPASPAGSPRPIAETQLRSIQPRFTLDVGRRVVASPVLSAEGDSIVVTLDGRLMRIASTGRIEAETALDAGVRSTPAVGASGELAIASEDGVVRILDRRLRERARLALGDAVVGPIRALPNGLFAIPTRGMSLVTPTGVELVRHDEATTVRGGALLHPGGFVVYATSEGELVAFRLDGTEVFRANVGASSDATPAIVADGSIVIGTDLAEIVRVGADGTVLARHASTLDLRASPVVRRDGSFVIATLDGTIEVLDATLAPVHGAHVPGSIVATPLVATDEALVVGTTAGFLHRIDRDATIAWSIAIGAPIRTTPLLLPDSTLVVVSDDGRIRGFR